METLVIIGFVVLALFGVMSWQTAIGAIVLLPIGMLVLFIGMMAVMAVVSAMRK